MARIVLKRGDTGPVLYARLLDADGNPVNLRNAVRVRLLATDARNRLVLDAPVFILNPDDGVVQYLWAPSDTQTPGTYKLEFEVTFDDDSIVTFPNQGYLILQVLPDLG